MAEVTTEALQTVKTAFIKFQTDIRGLSNCANHTADVIRSEGRRQVLDAEQDVMHTEIKISKWNEKIAVHENNISRTNWEIKNLESGIFLLKKKIQSLYVQIDCLHSEVDELRSQLSDAGDENRRVQFQARIIELEKRIRNYTCEISYIEDQIRQAENKKMELNKTLNSVKAELVQCESNLTVEKIRFNKQKDKLERLINAFAKVESDLCSFIEATKKFESMLDNTTRRNISAIDQCIACVEEYISALIK